MSAARQLHVDGYLDNLRTQRQLSKHTVSSYGRDLAQLLDMSQALLGERGWNALSHFHVRKFAAQLHAQGLDARSIARKLSCWRGFFEWLAESDKSLSGNPVEGVKPPRRDKPLPQALSADDAIRLVEQTPAARRADESLVLCNRAMFELLYSSGLRVSELTGLDVQYAKEGRHESLGWLDLDSRDVHVTGKGSKRRSVPVGSAALDALRNWLAVRASLVRLDPHPLFLSERGTRMTPRVVQMRLKAHALSLGIPTSVHPHVLRHSFASHVLQSSGDLRAVQEMLGHASIASTQVYTSLDFQHLAQVYDAAHPRAKKVKE
ncbi:MAG TPA: tyrosine recombinase XerC [Burkholderiaceae bacterium]